MKFIVVLAAGSDTIESIDREVNGNNNFADASAEAVRCLFVNGKADNVTAYRRYDDSTIASDHFFYGEKE